MTSDIFRITFSTWKINGLGQQMLGQSSAEICYKTANTGTSFNDDVLDPLHALQSCSALLAKIYVV